ncbi:MAG: type II toxin-antitoxin system death-on-curing family toxin [Marinoscillum sp.]|uniref:type II toxin-antitoxin system death-on-curing family toxin n=1 Tax=Marinoscillum sp. TaxID=2024838 RepID=UPI003300D230
MNSPSEFRWISEPVVHAIHNEQIARHGGLPGIRDIGLLESALARPKNLFLYEGTSLAQCAASYMYGIVRNHPFLDGNKRTGFVVGVTFLILNQHYVEVSEAEVVVEILNLANGNTSEEAIELWLRRIITPLKN